MKRIRDSVVNRWLAICLAMLVVIVQVRMSYAQEADVTQTGSFSATFCANEGETPLATAEITIYRLADATVDAEEQVHFTFGAEYAEYGLSLEQVDDGQSAMDVLAYITEKSIVGSSGYTDDAGYICFENLPLGIYLVAQTGEVAGFSMTVPFYVCMPSFEDGALQYDVDATPKVDVEILVDLSVKKVWNDDGEERPSQVKVALYLDEEVYDTVILSEANDWSYVWEDIPKSDAWSVKEIDVPDGYTASYKQDGLSFVVENTPTLVQTGQLKWPIPVLAAAGVLLVEVGILVRRKHDE